MNPEILAKLRDIQEIDPISWWPPAGGWWLLALLVLILATGLLRWLRNLRKFPPGSWNRDAYHHLMQLKRRARKLSDRDLAGALSNLLRRIAISRQGRLQAAGLSGDNWLGWLQEQDPQGFDWQRQGKLLLTLPYAPDTRSDTNKPQLLNLLRAAITWTEKR